MLRQLRYVRPVCLSGERAGDKTRANEVDGPFTVKCKRAVHKPRMVTPRIITNLWGNPASPSKKHIQSQPLLIGG